MPLADIVNSGHIKVVSGMELLDSSDALITDITDDLIDGQITHSNFSRIHGVMVCKLGFKPATNQRLKPYTTLTNLETGEEFTQYMGVYVPTVPSFTTGESPATYTIEAYDKLYLLDTITQNSYSVAAGTSYLAAAEAIIAGIGESVNFDPTAAAKTLPTTRVWALDEKNTKLAIVNDLLLAVGYRGVYLDRAGVFRSEPWESPTTRELVWAYDATAVVSIIDRQATIQNDYHEVPNVAVFVRDDPDPGAAIPTVGDGIYVPKNQSTGPTSIDARGREVVAGPFRVDVADHDSLVEVGDRRFEEMTQPAFNISLATNPNPAHWHAGVVTLNWPEAGFSTQRFSVTRWQYDLRGQDMQHVWRAV